MDKKTVGAWLVHHTNKLSHIEETGIYGAIRVAGKSGILLSALSASDQILLSDKQVRALALGSGIDTAFELPLLLDKLEKQRLIDRSDDEIRILGLTTSAVLEHAASIFTSEEPTPRQQAAIDLAEKCSASPTEHDKLGEYLSDQYKLSSRETEKLLGDAEQVGFTDAEAIDQTRKVYFNGALFRRDGMKKAQAVLASLSDADVRKISEVDDRLKRRGCLTREEVELILGQKLFSALQSIAMYDENVVSNSKERVSYVTRPGAFRKFQDAFVDDPFDLAKALVASLSYGIQRSTSSRGRITMISRLLGSLVNGSWIGPCTAIGEDYKVLETRGVVQVRPDGHSFSMRLLKREVGELALQVITEGDASVQSLPNLPGASITRYAAPEEQREIARKRRLDRTDGDVADLLDVLRTGKL